MIHKNNSSNTFFIFLFVLFIFSILNMYNKFIVQEDFHYFVSEEELPDIFDLSTYPK